MGMASRRSDACQVSCDVFARDATRIRRCGPGPEAEADMVTRTRTVCTKQNHQSLLSDPTRLAAEGRFTGYFARGKFLWAEIVCPNCSETLSLKLRRIEDER